MSVPTQFLISIIGLLLVASQETGGDHEPAPQATARPATQGTSQPGADPSPGRLASPPTSVGNLVVHGGDPDQLSRVEWAVGRFHLAGLQLPATEVHFHTGEAGCDGADAVFRTGSDPLRIDVCNSHRLIVLHELAHAWDHANLNQEQREAFMVMCGFDVWNDHDVPWKERAVEHLAEILVWGLHERGAPDAIKQAAFYFATGTQPSWLSPRDPGSPE
jgi:hypothetical protein